MCVCGGGGGGGLFKVKNDQNYVSIGTQNAHTEVLNIKFSRGGAPKPRLCEGGAPHSPTLPVLAPWGLMHTFDVRKKVCVIIINP